MYGAIMDGAAWIGQSFAGEAAAMRTISSDEIAELEACCQDVETSGCAPEASTRAQFKLPCWESTIASARTDLQHGRGFVLLRGLPVARWGKEKTRLAVWGLGLQFGDHVSQTVDGRLICDVMDTTNGEASPRQYKTNRELSLHTDPVSDIIGLACLMPAKSGGVTVLASAVTIYEQMRRRAPELLDELFRGFHLHRFGEGRAQDPEVTDYRVPMLWLGEGKLACRYVRSPIVAGHKALGLPLTAVQVAALDLFDEIASDPANHISFTLQQGDLVLVNNLCVLHARTSFEEHDEPERHRHLLRLWLKAWPGFRPVPREMNYFNDGECGIPVRAGYSADYNISQLSRADGLGRGPGFGHLQPAR